MTTAEFHDRIVSRLDRVDRKSLEQYVQGLMEEKQLLVKLLDQVPHGIMILSHKKQLLYLNRRMMHLFNISDSVRTKAPLEEMFPDEEVIAWITDAFENQVEKFNEEVDVLLPRPMKLEGTILQEQIDEEKVVLVFLSNLSEKERTARERFQNQNLESMVSLAAGIAHEIGNPLNSLTIHLRLLTKALHNTSGKDKKKIEKSLKAMKDETARLDGIVRNFLKASRRRPLHYERGQVNDVLTKTIEFAKPELDDSHVKIVKSLDKNLTPFLFDAERIQQVFVNIIKNALHAMPKGGTLQVTTESKGKLCLIHFRDTGKGIPEEELPKIFEAYYTTKEEGSGLGLLIVYQIIREHGGRLEVASVPNAGATFTIVLPIRKEKLGLPGPAGSHKK
jgi:two-component system, sporulation sensor kinase E